MWCAMTLCHPERPPLAERVVIRNPLTGLRREMSTYGATLTTMRTATGEQYWFDKDRKDRYWGEELVMTVMWMMAHFPDERPSLDELQQIVDKVFEGPRPPCAETQARAWAAQACKEPQGPHQWQPQVYQNRRERAWARQVSRTLRDEIKTNDNSTLLTSA